MNNSLKGVLLSGLVIPGLGQFVLKQYLRGTVMMVTILVSVALIAVKTVQLALAIMEKIQLEGEVINLSSISDAALQASPVFESLFLVIIGCWIIGAADAYMIGRKIDTELAS